MKEKKTLLYLVIGTLLLISYILPTFWPPLDLAFFHSTNQYLKTHPKASLFWALANHKTIDWLEDLGIFFFFFFAIKQAARGEKIRKAAELIFSAFFIALTVILINRVLCHDLLRLRRESPTSLIDGAYRLSEALPWLNIKDISSKSFPGDHATTALLFGISYATFVRGRLGFAALVFASFLSLPRLMTGAHWLSDVIVGSGVIICFAWGLALSTPFAETMIQLIEKLFLWYRKVYDKAV